MKKTVLLGVTLLSVVALAACSTSSKTTTSSSSKETSTTTVESSSETKSSSSSTETSSTTLKESTVTYLSDAEIEAISTIADYKNAFQSLTDSYVKDFGEVIDQMPEEAKSTLEPYRQQLLDSFEKQKETLDTQFAALGDDSTELPAESHDTLVSSLKQARDMLKDTMKTVREQAASLLK